MDMETVRDNERVRGIASYLDNASLALFAASIAKIVGAKALDVWSGSGLFLGVVSLWLAWHTRDQLQPEE